MGASNCSYHFAMGNNQLNGQKAKLLLRVAFHPNLLSRFLLVFGLPTSISFGTSYDSRVAGAVRLISKPRNTDLFMEYA